VHRITSVFIAFHKGRQPAVPFIITSARIAVGIVIASSAESPIRRPLTVLHAAGPSLYLMEKR